jgi:hypothetical protein
MPGFASSISNKNDVVFAKNADFSLSENPSSQNGLIHDGQLWIGKTNANEEAQHIFVGNITSPDSSITVGYSHPNITIVSTSGIFNWVDISGTFTAQKTTGYFITGTSSATLPSAPVQGDTIKFLVDHSSQVLTIHASPGQIIRLGENVSSIAGTVISTVRGDSLELVYRSTNLCWEAVCGFVGTWIIS